MKSKAFSLLFFSLLIFMVLYVVLNPSYQKSIQAKYYFETGEYKEALLLAKEAFALDIYNRMSSTIMSQSLIALKYTKYIENGRKYITVIEEMANKDFILEKDRAKIRLMCGIMVDSYKKLSSSVITDKELVNTADGYYMKFESILEKVNR